MACKCKKNPKKRCHVGCLRNFVSSKVTVITRPNSITYEWKDAKCKTCNHDYRTQIRLGQDAVDLVSFDRPKEPCLILEKTSKKEKNRIYVNEIVVLKVRKHHSMKIGHGPNCDLRMSDISTSVVHSKIVFEYNRFMIYDNKSRFGTLVELRKPFKIENNGVALQVENKIFKIFTEGNSLVKTMKKRKFKRFEMTLNRTQNTVMMNLATRMKCFPALSMSKRTTLK